MYTYLASPYTHPDSAVRQLRHQAIMQVAAVFLRNEEVIYSPILHFHYLSITKDLPTDFAFWERQSLTMLKMAKELVLVKLGGWTTSKGMQAEYEFAKSQNLPIFEGRAAGEYKIQLTEEPW